MTLVTQRVLATLLIFVCFLAIDAVHAADGLPEGCHKATQLELWNNPRLIGKPVCPEDAKAGITETAGAAKQDLNNARCNSGVNVAQLDSKFAVCAARFVKALRNADGSACITSAYRNRIQQENACRGICGNPNGCPGKCARPGRSYHQKGLAIDMKYRVSHQTMWKLAAQSGLHNPPGLHSSDPIHVQSSGASNCAGIQVPSGDGGDEYNDTDRHFPAPPPDYQAPRGQQFSGPPPQQPDQQQPEQMCTLPDGIQVPCSQIANRGSPPAGGQEQGGQSGGAPQSAGASGGQQGGAPQQQTPPQSQQSSQNTPQQTPISDLLKTNLDASIPSAELKTTPTSTKKTPAINLIDAIGSPSTNLSKTTETTTNAPLVLTIEGSETRTLVQNERQQQTDSIIDDSSYQPTYGTQQTFKSNDLNQNPAQNANASQERSIILATLNAIKETLLRVLEYLRPFGRPPSAIYIQDEWNE
ncbi:MAG: M15 family metallopeptidase [Patescibacteria group bacterium]